MRRTGYPKVFPVLNVEDGDGSIEQGNSIRRVTYILDTEAAILDVQTTGLEALGGMDLQATRLWWDVDGSNF